jgi:hypothetical protein
MKKLSLISVAALVAACGDVPERVFFEQPAPQQLEGVWSGTEEITTDDDLASNSTYSEYGKGFSFPVVVQFDGHGRFMLWTGNFSTSYLDPSARTCSGVYTQSNASIRLLPSEQCRALPLTNFTLGRVLPAGITMEARTGASLSSLATYASFRVRFRLDKD